MRLCILGVDSVGSTVAELAPQYGHTVTAIADTESALVDGQGIDVPATLQRKEAAGNLGDRTVAEALDGPYDVLVETTPTAIGDAEPAFGHLKRALARDRHVVLGNKGPVAERYGDVRAARHGRTSGTAAPATGQSLPVRRRPVLHRARRILSGRTGTPRRRRARGSRSRRRVSHGQRSGPTGHDPPGRR